MTLELDNNVEETEEWSQHQSTSGDQISYPSLSQQATVAPTASQAQDRPNINTSQSPPESTSTMTSITITARQLAPACSYPGAKWTEQTLLCTAFPSAEGGIKGGTIQVPETGAITLLLWPDGDLGDVMDGVSILVAAREPVVPVVVYRGRLVVEGMVEGKDVLDRQRRREVIPLTAIVYRQTCSL
ncbi:hypothetical protein BDD12DRAFT_804228 [Trichophaea hybrida]|nr:hypothetical protein BDD12DRAFT_804228 [Trichophaea hybrida]